MIRLKFIHQWVDKRNGGAKPRYYFRRPGFARIALPGLPGSTEFMSAYQAALTGQALPRPMIGASRTKAGSLGAVIVSYMSAPSFLSLKDGTRQTYRLILERFRCEHGEKPVALLTRQHINAMLALRVAQPSAANHWLRLVKALMAFAVEEGFRPDNPSIGVKRIKTRSDGFYSWSDSDIEAFEARHPVGSKARLALALLLVHRGAAVRRGSHGPPAHSRRRCRMSRQQKTGEMVADPVASRVAAILAATPSGGQLTFLTTAYGQPFTAAGFGAWFRAAATRRACRNNALPTGCARPPAVVWRRPGVRLTSSRPSAATPRCGRSNATPRPPTRSAWRGRAWRRSYREQRAATARAALPKSGKKP